MGRQAVLPCQRHLFDLPDEVAYLNCAYLSPLLKTVLQAGQQGVARKAHPWRIETDDFHLETETARGLFADLIGAKTAAELLLESLESTARAQQCRCMSLKLLNPKMRRSLRRSDARRADLFEAAGFRGEPLRLRKCFEEGG